MVIDHMACVGDSKYSFDVHTHTGPFLYYLFIVIGWPFLHYVRENTYLALGISLAMESFGLGNAAYTPWR